MFTAVFVAKVRTFLDVFWTGGIAASYDGRARFRWRRTRALHGEVASATDEPAHGGIRLTKTCLILVAVLVVLFALSLSLCPSFPRTLALFHLFLLLQRYFSWSDSKYSFYNKPCCRCVFIDRYVSCELILSTN